MRLKHVKNADLIMKMGKYYIDDAGNYKGRWLEVFGNSNPIYIEIGTGKGDYLIQMAILNPSINFIGIEKYDSVLVRAIQKSNELEINNLRFIRMDASNICDVFDKEVDLIYLNFSDPWPKERHAKRRLTSMVFLDKYQYIFKGDAHIIMKTDNINLFNYSLESLKEFGYNILFSTNDLHNSHLANDNVCTEYERRFVQQGVKINYLDAVMKR